MNDLEAQRSPLGAAAGVGALVLGSIVALLFIIEFVIRSTGVSVGTLHITRKTMELDPNPQLLFRLKPNAFASAEVTYRTNALRQRGPETTAAKPPNVRRIVVSGDSIAFGYWVEIEDAFGSQLQQMTNESRRSDDAIEVINLGVPGYNLGQEFEHLQNNGLHFDPDLVVISICLNDLDTIFGFEYGLAVQWEKERRSDGAWKRLRAFALDHSLFAAWLEYRFRQLDFRREWAGDIHRAEDAPMGIQHAATAERRAMVAKQEKSLGQALATFERLLRINGDIPSLVVLFPGLDYDYSIYPHQQFHDLVATAAADAGLEFLDLLSCYSGYSAPDLAVDPVHPSPIGHRIAAHAILDAIADRSLIPGAVFDTERFGDCHGYRTDDFPKVRGF